MKIAILSTITGYTWGGTEEVWHGLATRALADGHSVLVAADHQVVKARQTQGLVEKGLRVSPRRIQKSPRIHRWISGIRPDHRELENFDPDVIMINAGSPFDLHYNPHLAAVVNRQKCHTVFFCHFNSDRLVRENGEAGNRVIDESDHFVFVSEANRKQMEVQLARRIPNATVLLNQSRLELDQPLGFPEADPVQFANVARLETQWKAQDLLPQIFDGKQWRDRGVKVQCYGLGPDENYLKELLESFPDLSSVTLEGYSRDVEPIWNSCHALLLPSRGEGTPLVAVEAMMCGRPVIATDVGGNTEIIEDGVTGFIAEAPTVRSFGAALERAWQYRSNWPEMGRRAHQKAKELAGDDPAGRLLKILTKFADQ